MHVIKVNEKGRHAFTREQEEEYWTVGERKGEGEMMELNYNLKHKREKVLGNKNRLG